MARVFSIIINILLILFALQIAPSLIKGIKKTYTEALQETTKIGVVTITDCISDSARPVAELKKFFSDADIKAIVIKFDSPGGYAGASQAIFNDLKEFKKQYPKPTVAWVQNICASGAYYVACAADAIIATPSAYIGSIGVYITLPHLKKCLDQLHIKYDAIQAGSHKMAGSPFLETTPAEQLMFKGLVDDTYRQFIADVASQRSKLTLHTATEWADGKVFTGTQALEIGLIDEIGSRTTVEQYLRRELVGRNIEASAAFKWIKPSCPSALSKMLNASDSCDQDDASNTSNLQTSVQSCITTLCSWFVEAISNISTAVRA